MNTDACRICGASGATLRATKSFGGFESRWTECEDCHVQRITPYPSNEELERYYDTRYLSMQCSGTVDHALRFSDAYRETLWREYAWSSGDVGIDFAAVGDLRLLDYGCADGPFLDYLVDRGLAHERLCGVDISEQMIGSARLKGYRGLTLSQVDEIEPASFDFVTMWDSLEHVPDPIETVRLIRDWLAPGGRLLAQTPRVGLLSDALGEAFEHYLPFEHLHLFPRDAFRELFDNLGFEVLGLSSFGANAPPATIPAPFKSAFDRLAKSTDQGATQVGLFRKPD